MTLLALTGSLSLQQFGQGRGNDLPGYAKLVPQPPALAFSPPAESFSHR